MSLPSAVHVSPTFEFGAMLHDSLSADPQGNPPFSPFFLEHHECYCLALFMCPPPSSLELCFIIA